MAFSGIQTPITMDAADDLDTRQFHAVDLNSQANRVGLAAAGAFFGVVQNHPRSLEAATVVHMGVTKCIVGGAVGVGERLTTAATGFFVTVTSGGIEQLAFARCLVAAASGFIATMAIERTTTISGAAN